MTLNTINLSDNIEFIKTLPDNSIDAIITDSPYGLGKEPKAHKLIIDWVNHGYHEVKGNGFMGKKWDAFVPQPALWKECFRVLKPGGYLLSFFGTRTYDWGTLAIRLAGFEIRDCIQWIYGSGFPKSKANLKPANEPICVARKPGLLIELNINECRIPVSPNDPELDINRKSLRIGNTIGGKQIFGGGCVMQTSLSESGRYPSNVIFSEDVAELLDAQTGILKSGHKKPGYVYKKNNGNSMGAGSGVNHKEFLSDSGGASRFFYVAKASPSERAGMKHPTIKPVKLMTQLVKLYCPVGGVVLDPHFGTGPTGEACLETGRNFIGIDNDPQSIQEAKGRMERWYKRQNNESTQIKIAI